MNIGEEVEGGFTYVPFGCKIVLEEKAKRNVKWLPADEEVVEKIKCTQYLISKHQENI